MVWLLGILVVIALAAWLVRRGRDSARSGWVIETRIETSVEKGRPSKPDNPRFATWEEAMNRPITDKLRFWIEYCDINGVITEREITPIMIRLRAYEPNVAIDAWCHLRNEERTFQSARILRTKNLTTGRQLHDLGQYLRGRY